MGMMLLEEEKQLVEKKQLVVKKIGVVEEEDSLDSLLPHLLIQIPDMNS